MSIFLDPDDVAILTGKKTKSGQVAALRTMGIAFFVNPSGRPVVPKASVEGKEISNKPKAAWEPSILNHHG
ncbi:MAG: DUF4224 domain-containing protein [Nitrosomonas sp.]|uniref:DUF4224 domain-containing protein n=1 Tax=Nitrosomonas sp. TaxID=42353 RepID=UPI0025EA23A0|nr:DUF4224 domain-containing protein [Nitrosomonas sp.]MBY0474184.1 DUF4224 domain-containing protein [Nitrosomonas sp.]